MCVRHMTPGRLSGIIPCSRRIMVSPLVPQTHIQRGLEALNHGRNFYIWTALVHLPIPSPNLSAANVYGALCARFISSMICSVVRSS